MSSFTLDDMRRAVALLDDMPPPPQPTNVVISPPYRVFSTRWLKAKRKRGPRWQKVKHFEGWREHMKDGEIYQTPHGLIMNSTTAQLLKEAT